MLAITLSILSCMHAVLSLDLQHADSKTLLAWEKFKLDYGKSYDLSGYTELAAYKAFAENLQRIEQHNKEAGKHGYTLGLNEYADVPHDKFVKTMNGFKGLHHDAPAGQSFIPPANSYLPGAVDWRNEKIVTPVKNQGQCGSCWSFSSTGALEGQLARKRGYLVSLSEQNLVDCVKTNWGCGGGFMDHSFAYIKQNGGIDTEQSYPYTAVQGECHYKASNKGGEDTGFVDILPRGDEGKLQEAAAHIGPIAVAIDAENWSFQLYKSGVYYEPRCSSQNLDHAVLVVGYGVENGTDYWLVKNSWGETWGDHGYIKMARNRNNHCGIATLASYPTV